MTAIPPSGELSHFDRYERLIGPSFLGLLAVQFLGAVDDAIFRSTIALAMIVLVDPQHHALAVALPAFFTLAAWVLFSPLGGRLAVRYSKQRVLAACKVAELLCVAAVVIAMIQGSPALLCLCAFCLAAQFALSNPSKFGSIPDIVRPERIPAANALIGLTTMMAMIVGFGVGGRLFHHTFPAPGNRSLGHPAGELLALVFIGLAAGGSVAALLIRPRPATDPQAPLFGHLFRGMIADVRSLQVSRQMSHVVALYAFYWSLGTLAQLAVLAYGQRLMNLSQAETTPLLGLLALGAGLGCAAAGIWSAGIIELGLVPIGGVLFSVAAVALTWTYHSYEATAAALLALGFAGGLVNVPLYSHIQYRSPPEKRGSILAANNFVTFLGMIAATVSYYLLLSPDMFGGKPVLDPNTVFLAMGLFSLPVGLLALYRLRLSVLRVLIGTVLRCVYKIRPFGRENLPEGGALLVSNHISWLDGLLIGVTSPKPVRMIAYADYVEGRNVRWFSKLTGVIPINPGSRAAVASIRVARDALRNGEYVCIFAEGCLSRTGHLLQFMPGLLKVIKETEAPVVPVYLDGLWGSIFSFSQGRFFWKRPQGWRYPIGVHYGRPLAGVADVAPVRRAVELLGVAAAQQRKPKTMILTRKFLRECRRSRGRAKAADTSGAELSGGQLLLRSLVLRRVLEKKLLAADEKFVGVLLPPSVGAVVVNAALALARRVTVNLNYTVTADVMNACIREAGIRRVLTSRKVMQKLDLKLDAEIVYLEDFNEKIGTRDKLVGALEAYALPVPLLERKLGLHRVSPDDLVTVVFTSGSTGEPKGVMLSYDNIGSNVAAIDQVVHLRTSDVLVGILPFFHSFGYTVTVWTVLTLAPKGIYHYSPLDARQIGELCGKHGATILMATPTFLRSYVRRCSKEEFAKLDVVVTGAEKLPTDVADAFEKQFGVRPVEGYGCTELSPLVSVNVPPSRAPVQDQSVTKEGTVGRPVPGVAAKITNLETGEELPAEQAGMLWIKGPNVMRGYMNQPEKTAEVVRDGWYKTGDLALVDKDGFIKITGRQSRFSKIAGEMVPHIRIEEMLAQMTGAGEEEIKLAVTAVPDVRKGERLVVLHTGLAKTPEALGKELQQAGVPNLWIPAADSYLQVERIPVLGTGKLDLRGLKEMALERFGGGAAAAAKSDSPGPAPSASDTAASDTAASDSAAS